MRGKPADPDGSQPAPPRPAVLPDDISPAHELGMVILSQCLTDLQPFPSYLKDALAQINALDKLANQKHIEMLAFKADIASKTAVEKKQFQALKEQYVQILDQKVALALQAYDKLDEHIQNLDEELNEFEKDVREEYKDFPEGNMPITPEFVAKRSCKSPALDAIDFWDISYYEAPSESGPVVSNLPAFSDGNDIDPNEPLYCICKRVSFGEMVACDNEDCAIEWFHFECVGLKAQPKGKWYCPDCSKSRKK